MKKPAKNFISVGDCKVIRLTEAPEVVMVVGRRWLPRTQILSSGSSDLDASLLWKLLMQRKNGGSCRVCNEGGVRVQFICVIYKALFPRENNLPFVEVTKSEKII